MPRFCPGGEWEEGEVVGKGGALHAPSLSLTLRCCTLTENAFPVR